MIKYLACLLTNYVVLQNLFFYFLLDHSIYNLDIRFSDVLLQEEIILEIVVDSFAEFGVLESTGLTERDFFVD